MTLIESINRTRELAGMAPLSESQKAAVLEAAKPITVKMLLGKSKVLDVDAKKAKDAGITLGKVHKDSAGNHGAEIEVTGPEKAIRNWYASMTKLNPNGDEINDMIKLSEGKEITARVLWGDGSGSLTDAQKTSDIKKAKDAGIKVGKVHKGDPSTNLSDELEVTGPEAAIRKWYAACCGLDANGPELDDMINPS